MTSADQPIEETVDVERELDLESLKALAHPLRVRLFDALSTYGCDTASGLAERLGESSGATSYHLRQLEKHGFVHEVVEKGTGRERWWERTAGGISYGSTGELASPAGQNASQIVYLQKQASERQHLDDFVLHGKESLPEEWVDTSTLVSATAQLTLDQAKELLAAWSEFHRAYVKRFRDQDAPGVRPFHVQFNAFAVVDPTAKNVGG
jgi:DNA-binding transcriptional ArsR family regulator